MSEVLQNGADKITIYTAAVKNPNLIKEGAEKFGSQCIVLALDAKRVTANKWTVYIYGGTKETDFDTVEWAKQAVDLGAGEIMLTSMDCDGTKDGYDLELKQKISEAVKLPVIASGGGGELVHFRDIIKIGKADAVLAASIFHYDLIKLADLKNYLFENNIPVRKLDD